MVQKITVELHDPLSGSPVVTIKTWSKEDSAKPLDTLKIDMEGLKWKPRKTKKTVNINKRERRRCWSEFSDMLYDYDKTPKPRNPSDAPRADKITLITEMSQAERTVDVKAFYRGSVIGTLKMDEKGLAWLPRTFKVPKNAYAWESLTNLIDALKPNHRKK